MEFSSQLQGLTGTKSIGYNYYHSFIDGGIEAQQNHMLAQGPDNKIYSSWLKNFHFFLTFTRHVKTRRTMPET